MTLADILEAQYSATDLAIMLATRMIGVEEEAERVAYAAMEGDRLAVDLAEGRATLAS